MKLLTLVFTCKKYINRLPPINNTWGKTLIENNIPYYFVSSDIEIKEFNNNLLLENFTESYDQLPLKTFKALNASLRFDYDYLIKLDDDVFFNTEEFLRTDYYNFEYIGKFNKPNNNSKNIHFFKCSDEFKKEKQPTIYEYAEGAFYCLKRCCIEKICSLKEDFFINTPETYKGEDVLIGNILRDSKKLNLYSEESKILNMDITKNGISLHPVHQSLFNELYLKSYSDQIKILKENPLKNQYNLRDIYLKNFFK